MKRLMFVPLGMLLAGCQNVMPNVFISDVGYGKVSVAYDYVPYENLDQPEGTAPHLAPDRFKVADGFWQLVVAKAEEGCRYQRKSVAVPLNHQCITSRTHVHLHTAGDYSWTSTSESCEQYAYLFACTD